MAAGSSHEWIIGPLDCRHTPVRQSDHASITIDAHRNLCGPYTAAGALLRHLLPDAYRLVPDFVRSHELTLVWVWPDTPTIVPVSDAVMKSFSFQREGYLPDMTRRLAHGVTDFVLGYLALAGAFPYEITFEHLQHAESLDREWVAILLRRANPRELRLRIVTDGDFLAEPLKSALAEYATITRAGRIEVGSQLPNAPSDSAERAVLARRYIESECTADDPALVRAYQACWDNERRQLHRERAEALTARHERSLALGAIPLHCERAGTGLDAFVSASLHCLRMVFYDACLDLASRGRRLADPVADREAYGQLTRHVLFSLLLLGRIEDAEALCRECEAITDDPFLMTHCSYAMAMMHLRFYPPERRDLAAARAWVEKALAFTRSRPPSTDRTVNLAFLHNTMALVETKEGRPNQALEMLDESLAFLHSEAPDSFAVESPILYRNRALINERRGEIDAAVADFRSMLQQEESHAWAHLKLAIILRRRGQYADALERSNAAIAWSPPWANAYHERALIYTDLGRTDEALADYDRVLTLEPAHVDALSDRATLLYRLTRSDAARADVERGLSLNPAHARLLCLRGYLERQDGRVDEACRWFAAALEQKPALPDAVAAAVRRWLATHAPAAAGHAGGNIPRLS